MHPRRMLAQPLHGLPAQSSFLGPMSPLPMPRCFISLAGVPVYLQGAPSTNRQPELVATGLRIRCIAADGPAGRGGQHGAAAEHVRAHA